MQTLTELRNEFKDYYFDRKTAKRAVLFFERELVHIKGEHSGRAFTLRPWQRRIIRRLFGWKHISTGLRKYKTLYLELPRKNGKSALASGFTLYLLDADGEMGAEVASAAADREQAAVVFETAKAMVQINPKLSNRINVYRKSMAVYQTASSYHVFSSDVKGKHGRNLSGIIVDELHALPNRELVDVLITSTASRAQPLSIFLTTAGYNFKTICGEYHLYARKVLDGIIKDPSFMGVIYAADPKDDWTAESTWKKANPNYGVTVRPEYIREECARAKQIPAYENTFKRLHLNIWTKQESRWVQMELWNRNKRPFTLADLEGRPCYAGLDLSTTTDITALGLIFPWDDDTFKVWPIFWLPEGAIEKREKNDRVPYRQWAKEGHLLTTPGNVIDYGFVEHCIYDLNKKIEIKEIAIDRWNATQCALNLQANDIEVLFFGQGYQSMSFPTKEFNNLLLAERLHHNGNPVLDWMADNVAVEQDAAGNIKPSKRKSSERIDGIVALIMGLSRTLTDKTETSVYAERGLLVL